jgi:hypothetical protein
VSLVSRKYGSFDVSQLYGLPWHVTGIALLLLYLSQRRIRAYVDVYILDNVTISLSMQLEKRSFGEIKYRNTTLSI